MARFISVRVEVQVDDKPDAELRRIAQRLADWTKNELRDDPAVQSVVHAAGVVRRA